MQKWSPLKPHLMDNQKYLFLKDEDIGIKIVW